MPVALPAVTAKRNNGASGRSPSTHSERHAGLLGDQSSPADSARSVSWPICGGRAAGSASYALLRWLQVHKSLWGGAAVFARSQAGQRRWREYAGPACFRCLSRLPRAQIDGGELWVRGAGLLVRAGCMGRPLDSCHVPADLAADEMHEDTLSRIR